MGVSSRIVVLSSFFAANFWTLEVVFVFVSVLELCFLFDFFPMMMLIGLWLITSSVQYYYCFRDVGRQKGFVFHEKNTRFCWSQLA